MAQTRLALPNLDPAAGTEELQKHYTLFFIWLSDIVDVLNQDIDTLENALAYMMAVSTVTLPHTWPTANTVLVSNLPATGFVTAEIISTTNKVTISRIVVSAGQFDITFNKDPGATAIIKYTAYIKQP